MSHREVSCFCKAPGMCCCFSPKLVEFSEDSNVEPDNEYPHGKLYGICVYACRFIRKYTLFMRKYTLFNLQRVSIQISILFHFSCFCLAITWLHTKGGSKSLCFQNLFQEYRRLTSPSKVYIVLYLMTQTLPWSHFGY